LGGLAVAMAGFVALNVLAHNHAHAMLFFTRGGSRTGQPEKLAGLQRIKMTLQGIHRDAYLSLRRVNHEIGASRT